MTVKRIGTLPLLSKAVLHDKKYTLEVSGQIGFNSEGKLVEGIEAQTRETLENIKKILAQVGWNFSHIVKVRIYLTDMKHYSSVNEIYKEYFSGDFPARVALGVNELPLGALVEIECSAVGDSNE